MAAKKRLESLIYQPNSENKVKVHTYASDDHKTACKAGAFYGQAICIKPAIKPLLTRFQCHNIIFYIGLLHSDGFVEFLYLVSLAYETLT